MTKPGTTAAKTSPRVTEPEWNDMAVIPAICRNSDLSGAARDLGHNDSTIFSRINAIEENPGFTVDLVAGNAAVDLLRREAEVAIRPPAAARRADDRAVDFDPSRPAPHVQGAGADKTGCGWIAICSTAPVRPRPHGR